MGEPLTEQLLNELQFSNSLEAFLKNKAVGTAKSLAQQLHAMLEAKGLKKSEVIKNSGLNTTFAYQLFSGDRKATRNKVLQLAFAMQLDLRDTQRLLKAAGVNELYCKNRRDAIVIYCVREQLPLAATDDTLYKFGEPTICED